MHSRTSASPKEIDANFGRGFLKSFRRGLLLGLWKGLPRLQAAGKRGMDMLVSSLMLLFLAPAFIAIAAMIKLTDRGPVLFWQDRVGKFGRTFRFPKFRSMVVNAEALQRQLDVQNQHGRGVTFKMKRDPRITWIGRIIRRASIDELPQLWCVLKGDMSLVGPRPPLVREVARYTLSDWTPCPVSPVSGRCKADPRSRSPAR
jgi:lipopolysaccharide/colanic/teichoic acid biosynthesis glycosyltransferase